MTVSNSSERLRSYRDRWLRLLAAMDELRADAKELKLEIKADGFNVPELGRAVKAEHRDKVAELLDSIGDAALICDALGHGTPGGMIPNSEEKKSERAA